MTPQRSPTALRFLAPCAVALTLAGCGRAHHHDTAAATDDLAAPPQGTPAPLGLGTTTKDDAANAPQNADPQDPKHPDDTGDVNTATANLRGYFAVDSLLRERLTDGNQTFSLSTYLDGFRGAEEFGLAPLLGFSAGDGLNSGFRNGEANALSLVLWHMALGSLAAEVARTCRETPPAATDAPLPPLGGPFAAALGPVCKWPAAEAKDPAALAALWEAVMAHDAPQAELDAFSTYFAIGEYASASGETVVTAMLTDMFLNPYFLLRR